MLIQYNWNIITGKDKEIRPKESIGMAEYLDDGDKIESKGKNSVIESLLYDFVMISGEMDLIYHFCTNRIILCFCYNPSISLK